MTMQQLRQDLPLSTLFQEMLRRQAPMQNPFRAYLSRQEAPLTDLFSLGQVYGDVGPDTSFTDYLQNRPGNITGVRPEDYSSFLQRGSQALGSATPPGGLEGAQEYLSDTADNANAGMERQYGLAEASSFGHIAPVARRYWQRAARRAYDQFRYDQPDAAFLPWFTGRGNSFF